MTEPISGLHPSAADEALLEQLAEALRPPPIVPPAASVAALRREVDLKWKATTRARVRARLLAWARRLQRTGAAVAVLGGMAVGGTGMALAAGGSTSRPAGYPPTYLEVPVPSPAVQYHGARGVTTPSTTIAPRAARRPVSTGPSARGSWRATPGTSAPVSTAVPPARAAAGNGAPLRPSPAPTGYADHPAAATRLASAPTNPIPAYPAGYPDTGSTSFSRTPGTAPTTARWTGTASTTGTWPAASGWPETSSSFYWTARTGSSPSTAGSRDWWPASSAPSTRDRYRSFRTNR